MKVEEVDRGLFGDLAAGIREDAFGFIVALRHGFGAGVVD